MEAEYEKSQAKMVLVSAGPLGSDLAPVALESDWEQVKLGAEPELERIVIVGHGKNGVRAEGVDAGVKEEKVGADERWATAEVVHFVGLAGDVIVQGTCVFEWVTQAVESGFPETVVVIPGLTR